MEKKYKLTEETINVNGRTLYRIEALKDFNDIKKGDKGGFIENEKNLSQSDTCWVYGNARVYNNAVVYDNATISGKAVVSDRAVVFGNAKVFGNAQILVDAIVCEDAQIYGDAMVFGDAKVYEYAMVQGNAKVYGNAEVCTDACIYGDAVIDSIRDYIVFKNFWSSGRSFTWTRSNDMWKVGCFYGTGEELIEKAYKDSEISGREYERIVKYVETIKGE